MKNLLILLLSALSLTAIAEEAKIAPLQPLTVPGSTACNAMEISMVHGELRKAFGWQSNFQVLTRMDVDAMMKEMGFQQSGMVDDAQRKKIGVMTSAQYICVSSITKYQTQLYIEAYLVDVETGQMTNPATQYANVKNEDYSMLPDACGKLASEMLGEIGGVRKSTNSYPRSSVSSNRKQDYIEDAWGINMKMIWVEGGEFMMGCTSEQSDCYDDEKNVRRVTVDGFYIGMLEVTQSQWMKVMGTSIYQQRDKCNDKWPTFGVEHNCPMYYIWWEEAMEFCRILSNKTGKTYTLPTEAQWEYAARGGKKTKGTKYAGSNAIDSVAWYKNNSSDKVHPYGSKCANELGLYDMSGNVCEWCLDWYTSAYLSYDTSNPSGPNESTRYGHVYRGGCFDDFTRACRVSCRKLPAGTLIGHGFRVVCLP